MKITFDPAKRDWTLRSRGLDFEDAVEVFDGLTVEFKDERFEYAEERTISVGYLRGRMVILVWTLRGDTRRIISMRKANDREKARYKSSQP